MSHRSEDARALTARAREAARRMARASTKAKDRALERLAATLCEPESQAKVLSANAADLARAKAAGLDDAMLDRLRLDEGRLSSLASALREIRALPDPVGTIDELKARPSGIQVGRMRVPLGVLLIVYESRPNVTVDAAALCMKAGNAVILRGGKEARESNRAFAGLFRSALLAEGLPEDAALLVDDPDRELLYALLGRAGEIDLAIPRGGTSLIDAVNEHARVPVVQHYQGICHVYVHEAADLDTAERVAVNAKVHRPGVCNAMECLVVDERVAARFLPRVVDGLLAHGVEVRACEQTLALVGERDGVKAAVPEDFDTEFLSLTCAVKVVRDYDEAVRFLADHGSLHTESIITKDHDVAMRFLQDVDASCVMVNASTRFNDGGELGLGAELGISTTKLHAYGPMGLLELTTRKFVVLGHGETRGSPP